MLNYEIDPAALRPLAPPGTEIDSWNGQTFLSVVGFLFLNTPPVLGLPVPFHRNFEEINLRVYVRRQASEGWRRRRRLREGNRPENRRRGRRPLDLQRELRGSSHALAGAAARRIEGDAGPGGVRLDESAAAPQQPSRGVRRHAGFPLGGVGRRIHNGALLGLCGAAERVGPGVRRGAFAVARVAGVGGAARLRRGGRVRSGISFGA